MHDIFMPAAYDTLPGLSGWRVYQTPVLREFAPRKRTVPVFKVRPDSKLRQLCPAVVAEFDAWLEATFGVQRTMDISVMEREVVVVEKDRAMFMHPATFRALRVA